LEAAGPAVPGRVSRSVSYDGKKLCETDKKGFVGIFGIVGIVGNGDAASSRSSIIFKKKKRKVAGSHLTRHALAEGPVIFAG